jgi:hypothetical protein
MLQYTALSERSGHVRIGPITLVVVFDGELVAHWAFEWGGGWLRARIATC